MEPLEGESSANAPDRRSEEETMLADDALSSASRERRARAGSVDLMFGSDSDCSSQCASEESFKQGGGAGNLGIGGVPVSGRLTPGYRRNLGAIAAAPGANPGAALPPNQQGVAGSRSSSSSESPPTVRATGYLGSGDLSAEEASLTADYPDSPAAAASNPTEYPPIPEAYELESAPAGQGLPPGSLYAQSLMNAGVGGGSMMMNLGGLGGGSRVRANSTPAAYIKSPPHVRRASIKGSPLVPEECAPGGEGSSTAGWGGEGGVPGGWGGPTDGGRRGSVIYPEDDLAMPNKAGRRSRSLPEQSAVPLSAFPAGCSRAAGGLAMVPNQAQYQQQGGGWHVCARPEPQR